MKPLPREKCVLCGREATKRTLYQVPASGKWRCKDEDACHVRRKQGHERYWEGRFS